jgi:23S rRNA maturation mini-RNase III
MARRKAVAVLGAEKQSVVIEKLLSEVQKALVDAQARMQDPSFPALESVTLTLQTALTLAAGGKISVVIGYLGVNWQSERLQEIVLKLTPPARESATRIKSLANQLADAIVEAAEGVRNAKTGKPPLDLQEFKAAISFAVTLEISGGIKTPKIQPVTLELSGSLKDKELHKIELLFKKK